MNKIIGLLATTIISAGLSFSASADKVTLKFHTFVPMPANSNAKFVKPWADKVTKESNGEIITEMYPSMQLGGKPPQLVDQVREGVVDLAWTVAGYTPGRFPRLSVFELPFMPTSAKITAQAVQEFVETAGAEDLKDYKILAVHVHAPGMIHTKKTLIKSVADFKGLKLRGPTRSATNLLKKLGATPVGMPVPKVAPSLSKGVIDGMVVPWEIMPSFKLQELTKSHTNIAGNRGLYTTPFLFIMNKAKYNSLSDAHKKIIDNKDDINNIELLGGNSILKYSFNNSKSGNPNEFLGVRDDLTPEKMSEFAKKFKDAGATILGGCCETRPSHIKEMSMLK